MITVRTRHYYTNGILWGGRLRKVTMIAMVKQLRKWDGNKVTLVGGGREEIN
jgi:hypothetical protein